MEHKGSSHSGPGTSGTIDRADQILDASPNAILAVDADGIIRYANPRAPEMFGYSRDQLIGRDVDTLLPERLAPGHARQRAAFFMDATARPLGTDLDLAARRQDGTEFPVEISLTRVESDTGPIVYATVVDITARRAAEGALAQSEQRFKTVLEASPNAILAVDSNGDIAYANPQVEATFGYERDELVGQPLGTVLPERVLVRHLNHRKRYFERPTARPMGIGLDLSGRRRDGTEFPVEISLSPVDTDEGRLVFATVVDITARKAAEAALAESERRFRTVHEASANAIISVNADGLIIYANPSVETTFGYSRDELIGAPVERLVPDSMSVRHEALRRSYLDHPAPRPMGRGRDLLGRRRDGTEFPVEISLAPVDTPDGLVVFATIADINARKALESNVLQAQKMESIGRLAGGIAHDFNNMLSAIRGYADIIEVDLVEEARPTADLEDVARSARAISTAADRAAGLTSQLLAFARQQVLQPDVLDLRAVVLAVEPMLNPLIGERIRLVLALDSDTGNIRADGGQLDQIIINLVVNARDALPDGGTITIQTGNHTIEEAYAMEHFGVPPGSYVMLAVGDDGVGMDADTRQHIFEPFFTTKEIGRGTGLGLATTFGTVRQSGGHIWLYSEPGRGTIFKLYFPRVAAHSEAPRRVVAPTTHTASGTLLVVEDEPLVRDLIVRVLGRVGYSVVVAPTGGAALSILESGVTPIAAVVSDVVMPGMTGTELAKVVVERFPGTGMVLLSGYTAETLDLVEVLERGARFLTKPFSADQLARAVASAIPVPSEAG